MRKVLAIILATVMVLSLCACGEGGGNQPVKGPSHDPVTYVHSTKNEPVAHKFIDGKCKYCDETSIFTDKFLSENTEVSNYKSATPGTIVEFTYNTRVYYVEEFLKKAGEDVSEIMMEKRAFAYLPNGYDESKQYNVLYLLHGSGLNEGYWFAKGTYEGNTSNFSGGNFTVNVLDYLVDKKIMEDTIIITPTYFAGDSRSPEYGKYNNGDYGDGDAQASYVFPDGRVVCIDNNDDTIMDNFYKELENYLMPAVVEQFSTYAKSGSIEDLIAARDHQAYAGLSLGSMTGYRSIWMNCLDVISYIGNFSGGPMGADVASKKAELSTYPLHYWFVGEGTEDKNPITGLEKFIELRDALGLKDGSDIANGDNCAYIEIEGGAHNYAIWITFLYDALQVFFK